MLKRRQGVLGHFERAVHLKKAGIALRKNSGLKVTIIFITYFLSDLYLIKKIETRFLKHTLC